MLKYCFIAVLIKGVAASYIVTDNKPAVIILYGLNISTSILHSCSTVLKLTLDLRQSFTPVLKFPLTGSLSTNWTFKVLCSKLLENPQRTSLGSEPLKKASQSWKIWAFWEKCDVLPSWHRYNQPQRRTHRFRFFNFNSNDLAWRLFLVVDYRWCLVYYYQL